MENPAPVPAADTPPTPPPAAPPGVDPAASAALLHAAAKPKKRGRPAGSGDKKPRVRVRKPAGAGSPMNAPVSPPPASAANTFDGPAPGMGEAAAPPPQSIPLDPEALAAMALGVGNAVVGMVAQIRYPPHIAATVPLQAPEIEALQPILTTWLKTAHTNLDPGTAFLLLAGCTLGLHVLAAEAAMRRGAPAAPAGGAA